MTFIAYSLAALVAFSGVIAGAVLAFVTKEEMPTARRYLPWLQKLLFIAVVSAFLNHFKVGIFARALVYALLLLMLLPRRIPNFYPAFGFAFFLLGQSGESLFLISSLVFLYGFPAGSLLFVKNQRIKLMHLVKIAVVKNVSFLIIAVALQFLYSVFILKTFN